MVKIPYKTEELRLEAEREYAKTSAQLDQWAEENPSDISPEMIIAMKALLVDDERLQRKVVTAYLRRRLIRDRIEADDKDPFYDSEEAELLRNPRVVRMIEQAAELGSDWQQLLSEALAMPGAEWPKYQATPDWVAGALADSQLQKDSVHIIEMNPDRDHTEYRQLMDVVYGGARALMDRHWGMPIDDDDDDDGEDD